MALVSGYLLTSESTVQKVNGGHDHPPRFSYVGVQNGKRVTTTHDIVVSRD